MGYSSYTIGSELEPFIRDGIQPDHAQQLWHQYQSVNLHPGYIYQIPDYRTNSIFMYVFDGRSYSGWRLSNVESRYSGQSSPKYNGSYMGMDLAGPYYDNGSIVRVYDKPKEKEKPKSDKKPKQIRHQYLRNVIRERIKK